MTGKEFRSRIRELKEAREAARESGRDYRVSMYTGIIKAYEDAYYDQFTYSLTEKGRQFQEQRHGR
jgi:Rod binding domain-containing protein